MERVLGLLQMAALPIGSVWVLWGAVALVLRGNLGGAMQLALIRGFVVFVLLAAVLNFGAVVDLLRALGAEVFNSVLTAIRGAAA